MPDISYRIHLRAIVVAIDMDLHRKGHLHCSAGSDEWTVNMFFFH